MITATIRDNVYHLVGLSTDTKPTEYNGMAVGNGSIFTCIDTSDVYWFDEENQTWIAQA